MTHICVQKEDSQTNYRKQGPTNERGRLMQHMYPVTTKRGVRRRRQGRAGSGALSPDAARELHIFWHNRHLEPEGAH